MVQYLKNEKCNVLYSFSNKGTMRVDVFWENSFNVHYFLYISFLGSSVEMTEGDMNTDTR